MMNVTASDKNIKWSEEGSIYKLTPTDNMVTEKDYTIKAIEFPAPVRGMNTINGTVPERSVVPFVGLELYKDIINNSNPIDKFSLGAGDEYVTLDKKLRITIDSMPDSTSQDWIYEYYNPWAAIKTQMRAVPNLDIGISLADDFGNAIDENNIKPEDNIDASIAIKNTGEDTINDVSISIYPDPLLLKNVVKANTLKDTVYQLNKNEEKDVDVFLTIPVSLEEREYNINVSVTGHDIDNIIYSFNTSKKINVKGDIGSIFVDKEVAKSSTYISQYAHVALNVVNLGHMRINNIQIHDSIPDGLTYVNDSTINIANDKEIIISKSSIEPSSSWTIAYNLKPEEPGIYILPGFDANFSVGGKYLSTTSNEVGFRVFGPRVVLNKSAEDMGEGIINVMVNAKNIGNGFTKVIIKDQLPDNATLISGSTNLTTSLDAGSTKTMNYGIKIENDNNIKSLSLPPARATYYLDDWRFTTSSDEKYVEGSVANGNLANLGKGTGTYIILTNTINPGTSGVMQGVPQGVIQDTPDAAISAPEIEEEQKKVVATIPVRTPIKTPEKNTPGFGFYETAITGIVVAILTLLGKNKK